MTDLTWSERDDLLPDVPLTSGITYAPPAGFRERVEAVAAELTDPGTSD